MKRLLLFAVLGICLQFSVRAQFASPTVNGTIATGEYGTHTTGLNMLASTSSVNWYMTWDATNLYVGVTGANVGEAVVLYFDTNPQVPINASGNSNGTFVGFNYDGSSFASLPFGAERVFYVKNGYREYRSTDGAGGWSTSATATGYGSYSDNGQFSSPSGTREFSIPWTAINSGGRPASFAFFGYVAYGGGGAYGMAPAANPGGIIGTSARYGRYFIVNSTNNNSSVAPFSRDCFVFNSASDITNFGSISVYDFTMNTAGRFISRPNTAGGDWSITGSLVVNAGTIFFGANPSPTSPNFGNTIANSVTVSGGVLDLDYTNKELQVNNDVTLSGSGIIRLSNTTGGDLKVRGSLSMSGTSSIDVSGSRTRAIFFDGASSVSVPQNVTNTSSNSLSVPFLFIGNGSNASYVNLNAALSSPNATLSNGTLNIASGGTLTLSGAFTATSGTLTSNAAGTVAFTATGAQTIPVYNYGNLTIGGSGIKTLSGSTTVSGNLALNAGTLAVGTNTLSVAGNITNAGGVVDASSGTMTFVGTTAQTVDANSFTGNLNNLVVNNSSGQTPAVTLNSNRTVNGTLTLSNGQLSMNGNTLTIAAGGSIARSGGSLAAAPSFAGNVDLTFSNAGALTTGNEVPSGNVVRNVAVTGGGTVNLGRSIVVNGTLNLTSGIINLGANNLTATAASLVGGSANSYIRTSGAGAFTLKSIGNAGQLIPVGNSSYNALQIASGSGNTLDWTVSVADGAPSPNAGYTSNGALSRQWEITPSTNPVPNGGASITFIYGSTGGSSFSPTGTMGIWHLSSTGNWYREATGTPTSLGNGLYSVTAAGLTQFSPYALANASTPLPVTLLSFTGKRNGNTNELSWSTASEQNNAGFEVERSANGREFARVATVASQAQTGNSERTLRYTFSDRNTTGAKWYYRLKQVDLDGRFKYSNVISLSTEKQDMLYVDAVYPNPAKDVISVRVQTASSSGDVFLQLSDMSGRIVKLQQLKAGAGTSTTATMDISALASGVYHLKVVGADGSVSETTRIVKQ